SASGAFSLQGGSITAGAFDYFLFKGGASPGSQGNWYLRNELVAPVTPGVPPPETGPGTPPLPTPVPGAPPIPLFQPGVAVMSVVPSIARTLAWSRWAPSTSARGISCSCGAVAVGKLKIAYGTPTKTSRAMRTALRGSVHGAEYSAKT